MSKLLSFDLSSHEERLPKSPQNAPLKYVLSVMLPQQCKTYNDVFLLINSSKV